MHPAEVMTSCSPQSTLLCCPASPVSKDHSPCNTQQQSSPACPYSWQGSNHSRCHSREAVCPCSGPVQPHNTQAAPSTPAGWLSGPSVHIIKVNELQTDNRPGTWLSSRHTVPVTTFTHLMAEKHLHYSAENHKMTQV